MSEPVLIFKGIIIQRRLKNTEAGLEIKQAPNLLVNFRHKFINFLSLSPLEPSPPPPPPPKKKTHRTLKTITKIRYQRILHLSYIEVASKNSKSFEQRVQLIQMLTWLFIIKQNYFRLNPIHLLCIHVSTLFILYYM